MNITTELHMLTIVKHNECIAYITKCFSHSRYLSLHLRQLPSSTISSDRIPTKPAQNVVLMPFSDSNSHFQWILYDPFVFCLRILMLHVEMEANICPFSRYSHSVIRCQCFSVYFPHLICFLFSFILFSFDSNANEWILDFDGNDRHSVCVIIKRK